MKDKIYSIIFESDTKAGKAFDLILIWLIVISIFVVCIESVDIYNVQFGQALFYAECVLTVFFSIEYILRIYSIEDSKKYIFSFFGIVDLLAILPFFIGFFISGAHSLVVIRAIRILRIFRLLKLSQYVGEAEVLRRALISSKHKITVFLFTVVTIVIFMGAVMYLIEGKDNGFTSIPKSMYWAVVTMTTVGYGDLVPQTTIGRFLASFLMIMGYGIIAVPTGIVTAELTNAAKLEDQDDCPFCPEGKIQARDQFCSKCGKEVN